MLPNVENTKFFAQCEPTGVQIRSRRKNSKPENRITPTPTWIQKILQRSMSPRYSKNMKKHKSKGQD